MEEKMPFDAPPENIVNPSLKGFIRWAEWQDPEARYIFLDPGNCLLTQYGHSFGERRDSGIPSAQNNQYWRPSRELYEAVLKSPHTIRDALERARARFNWDRELWATAKTPTS